MNNREVEEAHKKVKESMEKELGIKNELRTIAIGYLNSSEPYDIGEVPINFIKKLTQIYHTGVILASLGHHDCELCVDKEPATSSSEKIIRDEKNKVEYIFPEMIFHYIEEHKFKPSQEFINFIMEQTLGGV